MVICQSDSRVNNLRERNCNSLQRKCIKNYSRNGNLNARKTWHAKLIKLVVEEFQEKTFFLLFFLRNFLSNGHRPVWVHWASETDQETMKNYLGAMAHDAKWIFRTENTYCFSLILLQYFRFYSFLKTPKIINV